MDAFETRMQFLTHLRRLTSAAQSINKVVSFLLKHSSGPPNPSSSRSSRHSASSGGATHAEADLWECILEELEKSNINAKINIFYMLDSLLDQSLAIGISSYRELVTRDLEKVVELTVPRDQKEGVLNRMSTVQVLNSWKNRRLLPVQQLEALLNSLQSTSFAAIDGKESTSNGHAPSSFSKNDILRRIEDDRERHKRLRERIWVLPVPTLPEIAGNPKLSTVLSTSMRSTNSPASPASPAQSEPKLVSLAGYGKSQAVPPEGAGESDDKATETALDVEFEQAWESIVSEAIDTALQPEDLRAMELENERCFG